MATSGNNPHYYYLDESGDLGFSPGGTAYFTIAFIHTQEPHLLKRAVKRTKQKFHIPHHDEMKGSTTQAHIKMDFLRRLQPLPLDISAITVQKANVDAHLRQDTNIFYNYMVGLSLVEKVLQHPKGAQVRIIVDRRVIAITSGFNFNQYVRYKVWYERTRPDIGLDIHHLDSHHAENIQAADIVCNSIFRKYEGGDPSFWTSVACKVGMDKRLFFK